MLLHRGVFVFCLLLTGCKEQILHDLSEMDANRLLTRLGAASITAEKIKQADSRWSLSVDQQDSLAALSLLSEARVLRDSNKKSEEASPLVSNREDQRFRFERRLSGELEETLGALPGVLEARVHLNLPPVDPLFGRPSRDNKGSASILIVLKRESELQVDSVAQLVSGASGISREGVSVLLSEGGAEGESYVQKIQRDRMNKLSFGLTNSSVVRIAGAVTFFLALFGGAIFVWWLRRRKKLSDLIAFSNV